MHIFRVRVPLYDELFKLKLEPGKWYLAETQNATPFLQGQPSAIESRYQPAEIQPLRWEEMGFRTVPRYDPDEKIWVIRAGGYGDLFYLLPVLRAIGQRLRNPKEQLTLQTAMSPFPTTVPFKFYRFPSSLDEIDKEAAILNMEDIPGELEFDEAGSTTIRYARRAGLRAEDIDFDDLFPSDLERIGEELWQKFHGGRRPRVFLALTASAATRSFPFALQVALALHQRAALFAATSFQHALPFPYGGNLKVEEWMGLVAAADGIIGVDTAPTHLAILLHKPTLAIFGAIPSSLRVPEFAVKSKFLKVIDVDRAGICPCKLNKAFCPVTSQPLCFALAAKTQKILEAAVEFITTLY